MQGRRAFIQQLMALSALGGTVLAAGGCGRPLRPAHHRTGVVLDPLFLAHDMAGHPESAERLRAIDRELQRRGLWDLLTPVGSRMATQTELLWAHSSGYIDEIAAISEHGGGYYNPYAGDTYLTADSFEAAKMAAGSAIEMNLAVYDRKVDNGFALLRPPGHHALHEQAMGFCLFNSDVIAARALQTYRGVERVAIVDFDVHHGNGTQDLTYEDPSIMAVSIHQHPFWPMTGAAELTGKGEALGTTVNCPFTSGAGDRTYLQAFEQVILPKLRAFDPQHIIVFAGYDGHWRDPLAEHRLSVHGFNRLLTRLKETAAELCGGRLALSLGGGYELESLAYSVAGSFEVLLGQPWSADTLGGPPRGEVDFSAQLDALKRIHPV